VSHMLVDSIQPGLWDAGNIVTTRQIMLPMDLATLIGVSRSVPVLLNESRRPGVTTRLVETQDCEHGPGCVARYTSASKSSPLIRQRALLVRDSFGTMAMPTMTPYFADITYLFWSADLETQLATRAGNADIVVFESLDHFLFGRLSIARLRFAAND